VRGREEKVEHTILPAITTISIGWRRRRGKREERERERGGMRENLRGLCTTTHNAQGGCSHSSFPPDP
jgi:hypothetical protein